MYALCWRIFARAFPHRTSSLVCGWFVCLFLFGCFAFKKVESCYVLYQTAALVQKNSEATQALAAQGDNLEKELGEIQKVLLSMQVDINSDRMIMLNSVKLEYYYIPLSSLPCNNMQKISFFFIRAENKI